MGDENSTRCRVFVVDDERVIASTIAVILNQAGFEATEFFSGEAALAAMRDREPDILLADLVMPFMSGVDLAVEVRKTYPKCKIVLISGHINTAVLLEDAHRQGYLFEVHTKPISPQKLVDMLNKLH